MFPRRRDLIMHARLSTYQGPPERIDEAIAAFDADDRLPELDGFREAYLLVDRDSGRMVTFTLWSDADAVAATAPAADSIRSRAATAGGQRVTAVDRFEVALHTRSATESARG
jgi:heme-degrading monooxygenase HmoA